VVGAVPSELVVLGDLMACEELPRLEMPGEVDEAKSSLEGSNLRRQARDVRAGRAGRAKCAIESALELDDPAAERSRLGVDLRLDPPHRARLLGGEVEPVGELEYMRGARIVVELGGEGVARPFPGEELGHALGRNRFDLPLLEASIGLLPRLVPFLRGVVALPAAGRPGEEKDRRDGCGYAAAASQRSQARS
jgi:hypothetical protein